MVGCRLSPPSHLLNVLSVLSSVVAAVGGGPQLWPRLVCTDDDDDDEVVVVVVVVGL